MIKELKILIGNIGAGKTTLCKELVEQGFLIISKDDIRYSLGAGNYLFDERAEIAIELGTNSLFETLCALNFNIVIDETNMPKKDREHYIEVGKAHRYNITALILPELSKKESVKRRLQNNHGDTPKSVWVEVWKRKHKEYEEPTKEEGFNEIILL